MFVAWVSSEVAARGATCAACAIGLGDSVSVARDASGAPRGLVCAACARVADEVRAVGVDRVRRVLILIDAISAFS